jgi:hypothetical protein
MTELVLTITALVAVVYSYVQGYRYGFNNGCIACQRQMEVFNDRNLYQG